MHKPDGLTLITRADLPDVLYSLQLAAIPGIGNKMHKRVNNAGISTVYLALPIEKSRNAKNLGRNSGREIVALA